MGKVLKIYKKDDTLSYLYNALKYVIVKRFDGFNYVVSDRPDVIYVGSPNVSIDSVDHAYFQMMQIKKRFNKESGKPIQHWVISYCFDYIKTPDMAIYCTEQVCKFFESDYQLVFAVHEKITRDSRNNRIESKYHAHIVINSVSWRDGKKYPDRGDCASKLKEHLRMCTGDPNWSIITKPPKDDYYPNIINDAILD